MTIHRETIIVGAGPAGLQMGYFMNKAKRDYLILEAATKAANFFTHLPRHRRLLSTNKRFNLFPEYEFNMRHDWNSLLSDDRSLLFPKYSSDLYPQADDLFRYMNDFAIKMEIKARYNTAVVNISKEDRPGAASGLFYLKTSDDREYSCKVLIMATGAVSERLPDFPGIELADTYANHDLDPKKYQGKRVAIIGRGNSAFEVTNNLAGHAVYLHILGGRKLSHAWNTHYIGDLRAINNTILDMYQLKSLHSYMGIKAVKLSKEGDEVIVHYRDTVLHFPTPGYYNDTIPYDKVIVCTGWNYVDTSLFADNCKPATKEDGKYPLLKTNWESHNIDNLYFMGTVMEANDRKSASGFIHGFRYNIRTLHHLMEERYHKVAYPVRMLSRDCEPVADTMIERASVESSIYQLHSFMGDVVIVPEDPKEKIKYYADLPVNYVMEQDWFKNAKHAFTMVQTFTSDRLSEHGKVSLSFVRLPSNEEQYSQAFLRPALRYYSKGKIVDEIYAVENLVLRFDTEDFEGDNVDKNKNLFKNFINKHVNLNPGKNTTTTSWSPRK
ncbi:FAD-dependent oxidoreductase domain-containing protein 2-like isoform X2 [Ptychodera flava]|uniref:FAD-dependent oxidoreductase domain-containing protein 2-like isoform X2 n=1 Tax=Ptychodera flava TaxID=63121 RepID=UPI003969F513